MKIVDECLDLFIARKLNIVGNIEQVCVFSSFFNNFLIFSLGFSLWC